MWGVNFFVVWAFICGCLLSLTHKWCSICKKSVAWCRFACLFAAMFSLLKVLVIFYKTGFVWHTVLAKIMAYKQLNCRNFCLLRSLSLSIFCAYCLHLAPFWLSRLLPARDFFTPQNPLLATKIPLISSCFALLGHVFHGSRGV